MKFSLYGGDAFKGVSLETILEAAKLEQGFFARAEESGSEGCYVEVARWEQSKEVFLQTGTGRWCRYAHLKCFGGEEVIADEGTGFESAIGEASRIANCINVASGSENVSFVHKLPDYGSKPEPNPLIPVAERLLVACRAGLNAINTSFHTCEEWRKLGDMLINAITDGERAGLTPPPQPTRLVPEPLIMAQGLGFAAASAMQVGGYVVKGGRKLKVLKTDAECRRGKSWPYFVLEGREGDGWISWQECGSAEGV